MPAPPIADIVANVSLADADYEMVLTVLFTGGPITVNVFEKTITLGAPQEDPDPKTRVYTFSADPFFRKPTHYIASGSVVVRFPATRPAISKRVTVSVLFTNMFDSPFDARYRLQLTSPSNTARPHPPDAQGKLVDYDDVVPINGTQNVVILIA